MLKLFKYSIFTVWFLIASIFALKIYADPGERGMALAWAIPIYLFPLLYLAFVQIRKLKSKLKKS